MVNYLNHPIENPFEIAEINFIGILRNNVKCECGLAVVLCIIDFLFSGKNLPI